jgi:hypothetical protein
MNLTRCLRVSRASRAREATLVDQIFDRFVAAATVGAGAARSTHCVDRGRAALHRPMNGVVRNPFADTDEHVFGGDHRRNRA